MRSFLKTLFAVIGVLAAAIVILGYFSAPAKKYVIHEDFEMDE